MLVPSTSRMFGLAAVWTKRGLVAVTLAVTSVGYAAAAEWERRPALWETAALDSCGIELAPVSPARLSDRSTGVLIAGVLPESPAGKAGLKVHDVVIRLDGQDVDLPEQLAQRLHAHRPGSDVVVTFVRAGKVLETKMTPSPAVPPVVGGARFDPKGEPPHWFRFIMPRTFQEWFDPNRNTMQSPLVNL